MEHLPIRIVPLSDAGGALVDGVSLRNNLTASLKESLRSAINRNCFLLFRNQTITLSDQLRFCSIFGEVLEASGTQGAGSFVTSSGELEMHFDHWLVDGIPLPLRYTILYGMQVTPVGGETVFANMKAAYKRLPSSLKADISEIRTLHCYDYSSSPHKVLPSRIRAAELSADQPRAVYPVTLSHPHTGERILYISPRNTDCVLEMNKCDSEALLQKLWSVALAPDNIYAHKWQIGDLLIWDNYAVLHGRRYYDPTYLRKLRRMCVL